MFEKDANTWGALGWNFLCYTSYFYHLGVVLGPYTFIKGINGFLNSLFYSNKGKGECVFGCGFLSLTFLGIFMPTVKPIFFAEASWTFLFCDLFHYLTVVCMGILLPICLFLCPWPKWRKNLWAILLIAKHCFEEKTNDQFFVKNIFVVPCFLLCTTLLYIHSLILSIK